MSTAPFGAETDTCLFQSVRTCCPDFVASPLDDDEPPQAAHQPPSLLTSTAPFGALIETESFQWSNVIEFLDVPPSLAPRG